MEIACIKKNNKNNKQNKTKHETIRNNTRIVSAVLAALLHLFTRLVLFHFLLYTIFPSLSLAFFNICISFHSSGSTDAMFIKRTVRRPYCISENYFLLFIVHTYPPHPSSSAFFINVFFSLRIY